MLYLCKDASFELICQVCLRSDSPQNLSLDAAMVIVIQQVPVFDDGMMKRCSEMLQLAADIHTHCRHSVSSINTFKM